MTTALQKITKRAKQLQRKYPGKKWITLVKDASREYRAGKLGATLLIEKGESKKTRPRKVVKVTRTKKGTYRALKTVSGFSDKVKAAAELSRLINEQRNLQRQETLLKGYTKQTGTTTDKMIPNYKRQLFYIRRLIKANKKQISIQKSLL